MYEVIWRLEMMKQIWPQHSRLKTCCGLMFPECTMGTNHLCHSISGTIYLCAENALANTLLSYPIINTQIYTTTNAVKEMIGSHVTAWEPQQLCVSVKQIRSEMVCLC